MASFVYSARGKTGETIKGTYEASDKTTVITVLKNKGYIPLDVKEKTGLLQNLNIGFISQKVPSKDLSVFCRQFATIVDAGIPVMECLDIIRKQVESKKLSDISNKVYEQVQKGRSLSEGLKEFKDELPSIMINMVEAGEASGTLDKVMDRLASHFENESKIISKVKGAMIYPFVIFVVAFFAVIALLKWVVPQFVNIFSSMGAELPILTRILIKLSEIIVSYFIPLIVVLIGLVVALIVFYRSKRGKIFFDRLYLKIPAISSMYKKMIAARFTRTMASLLSSGLPLIQSLEITNKVIDNAVMSAYLDKVVEDVTKGVKLSVAVSHVRIFPAMINSMINIGEESGSMDSMLDRTADFFEEETRTAVANVTSLIEPMIIVVMAVVVGGIVVSIAQPMFGMFENVQNM